MPSGNPEPRPAPGLTLPRSGQGPREAFLVLPGLNLHPHRLDPLADLLTTAGAATVVPRLTGFATPGDPALRRVRAAQWVQDVDAAWQQARARLPGVEPSLLGFSMGGLLGLVWSLEAGVPLRRAILLAPALRLRPAYRRLIRTAGWLVPGLLRLPSLSPANYRFHAGTTVAAYRAVGALERRLHPHLEAWLQGREEGLPPLLIVCSPQDELVDAGALIALARTLPAQVTLMPLSHTPRRGYPAHLGLDGYTLGEAEWQRLTATVGDWLRREPAPPLPAAGAPSTPPAPRGTVSPGHP